MLLAGISSCDKLDRRYLPGKPDPFNNGGISDSVLKSAAPSIPNQSNQFGNSFSSGSTASNYLSPGTPNGSSRQGAKHSTVGGQNGGNQPSGHSDTGSTIGRFSQPTGDNRYPSFTGHSAVPASDQERGNIFKTDPDSTNRDQISRISGESKYLPPGTNLVRQQDTQYSGFAITHGGPNHGLAGPSEASQFPSGIRVASTTRHGSDKTHSDVANGNQNENKYLSPDTISANLNGRPSEHSSSAGSIVSGQSGPRGFTGPNKDNQFSPPLTNSGARNGIVPASSYSDHYSDHSESSTGAGNGADIARTGSSKALGGTFICVV